jgi:hypothetical protein
VGGFHGKEAKRRGVLPRRGGAIDGNFECLVKCLFKSLRGKVMGEMGGKIFFALWGGIG